MGYFIGCQLIDLQNVLEPILKHVVALPVQTILTDFRNYIFLLIILSNMIRSVSCKQLSITNFVVTSPKTRHPTPELLVQIKQLYGRMSDYTLYYTVIPRKRVI